MFALCLLLRLCVFERACATNVLEGRCRLRTNQTVARMFTEPRKLSTRNDAGIKKAPGPLNRVLEVSIEHSISENLANRLLGNVLAHDGSLGLAETFRSEMSTHESVVIIGVAKSMSIRKKHAVTLSQ